MKILKKLDKIQKGLLVIVTFFVLLMIIDFVLKRSTDYELLIQMYVPIPIFILCYALGGLTGYILLMYKQSGLTRILASFLALINVFILAVVMMFGTAKTLDSVTSVGGVTTFEQSESLLLGKCYYKYTQKNIFIVEEKSSICTD